MRGLAALAALALAGCMYEVLGPEPEEKHAPLLVCQDGSQDCDANASNGCEWSCAACTGAIQHATSACGACSCDYGACESGWQDCDGSRQNGCEWSSTAACSTTVQHAIVGWGACACDYTVCESEWLDCDGNRANGCEYHGPACPTSLWTQSSVTSATLRIAAGELYLLTTLASGLFEIHRVAKSGGEAPILKPTDPLNVYSFAADAETSNLYLAYYDTQFGVDMISRISIGKHTWELYYGVGGFQGGLFSNGTDLFWTSWGRLGLAAWKGRASGGDATDLLTIDTGGVVAANATHFFLYSRNPPTLIRAAADGSTSVTIATGLDGNLDLKQFVLDATHLYWTEGLKTYRAAIDGAGGREEIAHASAGATYGGMVSDGAALYVVLNGTKSIDATNGTEPGGEPASNADVTFESDIFRRALDSEGTVTLVATAKRAIGDVAVDATHVYWVEQGGGAIAVLKVAKAP